jgi:uncharacterized protein with von Willebrand factor type A (vWA) domain
MRHKLLANLLLFARTLRASGVSVRASGVPDAIRALDEVGVTRKPDVRDALRAVLIFRHEDFVRFDELFEQFWRVWPETPGSLPQPMRVPTRTRSIVRMLAPGTASAARDDGHQVPTDIPVAVRTYSPNEARRQKDFAAFTPDDLARATVALAKLAWNPGVRVTRRWVAGPGRTIDLRRLLRVNAKHGGELIAIPYRVRRVAPRPLILICDVSGSMEPYTRMLLLFAHAIAAGERRVEVFVFSTRLTRVTRQFGTARVNVALTRLREAVGDWSGGTRIGEAIRTFNVDWGRRMLSRSPVVLLISDGWDLGDPHLLAREIARLQRSAFRLVWLNPLLGSPGYEPLTRGMRAALPFVDDFLPVHNMASLEALARHLNRLSERADRADRRRVHEPCLHG